LKSTTLNINIEEDVKLITGKFEIEGKNNIVQKDEFKTYSSYLK